MEHGSLDTALNYIQENPRVDDMWITAVDMPPAVIYYYQDSNWKISFSRSFSLTSNRYDISVYAIGRV